jgi:hypothetical protein
MAVETEAAKKTRRTVTLADKLRKLDASIEHHAHVMAQMQQRRTKLVNEQKQKAAEMLREAEGVE